MVHLGFADVGQVTGGLWGTASTTNNVFSRVATTPTGLLANLSGPLILPAPLRSLQSSSDSVPYYVLGTGLLGAHVAARNSSKAGTIGFGLRR